MTRVSWPTDLLCVGGSLAEADWPLLCSERSVRHVVDVRDEQQDDAERLRALDVELLLLPTRDHAAIVDDALASGVEWVVSRLRRGEKVFIHCEHGIGRSVLLSACVLVEMGDSPEEALWRIKRAREVASPSPPQLEAFIRFCALRGFDGLRFDQLARIVYAPASSGEHER
jgi:protein-tyrosine phosphatase